jgi:hypothetical protein
VLRHVWIPDRPLDQVGRHVRIEPGHVHDFVGALLVLWEHLEEQPEPLDEASAGEMAC